MVLKSVKQLIPVPLTIIELSALIHTLQKDSELLRSEKTGILQKLEFHLNYFHTLVKTGENGNDQ